MRYRLSILIALSAAAGAGCASLGPAAPVLGAALAAAALPATRLVALDGTATDLRTVVGGRVAVVSFWATWCDACVGEIDALKRLEAQAGTRLDAVVVSVAVGERRETVAAFARRVGL